MPFNAMSLFSGMGGDSLGIKKAGGNVIAYNEFWKDACNTHDINFPDCILIKTKTSKKKIKQ